MGKEMWVKSLLFAPHSFFMHLYGVCGSKCQKGHARLVNMKECRIHEHIIAYAILNVFYYVIYIA